MQHFHQPQKSQNHYCPDLKNILPTSPRNDKFPPGYFSALLKDCLFHFTKVFNLEGQTNAFIPFFLLGIFGGLFNSPPSMLPVWMR